jgi:hypothetical protein
MVPSGLPVPCQGFPDLAAGICCVRTIDMAYRMNHDSAGEYSL